MSHPQLQPILEQFATQGTFSDEVIAQFCENDRLHISAIKHFRENKDRSFVTTLLRAFIAHRKAGTLEISMFELMLGAYLVAMHKCPEDILLNWSAKTVDFDSYCAVDIQLVPFIGVNETIAYLSELDTKEANEALEYINDCNLDDLDDYLSPEKLPYWLKE